ncbi:hypothetical protein HUJ05_004808 [Dendroctonus ponderosae]|nr:hypothetical protein HUJ05_004808 [Dendroctonus ponderosae]
MSNAIHVVHVCVALPGWIQGEKRQGAFCLKVGWDRGEYGGEPGTGWKIYLAVVIAGNNHLMTVDNSHSLTDKSG